MNGDRSTMAARDFATAPAGRPRDSAIGQGLANLGELFGSIGGNKQTFVLNPSSVVHRYPD
jgi:hypothetical protein